MGIYRSESIAWASGSIKQLALDFLPQRGPRGGRNVVTRITLETSITATMSAAVAQAGADLYSWIKRVIVNDQAGLRRNLTGFGLRAKMHEDMGDLVPTDPSAHAISTTQTNTINAIINFVQEQARRPYDYCIPVDDLQRGTCTLEMPAVGDLITTTGVTAGVTAVSGTYCWAFELREEFDAEAKLRDCVEEFEPDATGTYKLPINNRLLRSAFVCKPATGGGTTTTTITDVSQPEYGLVSIPRATLKTAYLAGRRTLRTSQDPFYNDQATPLVAAGPDSKWTSYLEFAGQLHWRMNSTLTTPKVIMHTITPKSQAMVNAAAALVGADPRSGEVKTAGKTRRSPSAWGRRALYAPLKFRGRGR